MAITLPNPTPSARPSRLPLMIGLLAVLAPISYLAGRVSTITLAHTFFSFVGSGLVVGATGTMIGIPIGLFFGSMRSPAPGAASGSTGNTIQMEQDILRQLRDELAQNQSLFNARKGSTTMFARIDYLTAFWDAIKASGRLFVMQDAGLLKYISVAYYWLEQASNLEKLAYSAKYAQDNLSDSERPTRLISEARMLDDQLSFSLSAAIDAIDGTAKPK
jgi:hypothetical protein